MGSVGLIERPAEFELDRLRGELSATTRASGTDQANRSSLVTTRVSLARQAAKVPAHPGPVGTSQAVVDINPVGLHVQGEEVGALSDEGSSADTRA